MGAREFERSPGVLDRPAAIATAGGASAALSTGTLSSLDNIDSMIENVSKARGTYVAVQNRLEHRLANLATYQENLTASESRIRDVDMAA